MPEINIQDPLGPSLAFENAFHAYKKEHSYENFRALKQALADVLIERGIVPMAGPAIAIMEVMLQRKHFRSRRGPILTSFLIWGFKRLLPKNRPGWNDYWMVRWLLTKEHAAIVQIHKRTHLYNGARVVNGGLLPRADWEQVGWTAQLMVDGRRRHDDEFNEAISREEQGCVLCETGWRINPAMLA